MSSSARPRADLPSAIPENDMLDAILVLATLAFFAISLAYVAGCERL
jgi:hypothetical protein